MFRFGKRKRIHELQKALSDCLQPLKDELGNVPVEMQGDKVITASLLGICEGYAAAHGIDQKQTVALIVDAVFEEIFRRESTSVLTQVDTWLSEKDPRFMRAYETSKEHTGESLQLDWLRDYSENNFEPAKNLML